jgi:hypothetical protein
MQCKNKAKRKKWKNRGTINGEEIEWEEDDVEQSGGPQSNLKAKLKINLWFLLS